MSATAVIEQLDIFKDGGTGLGAVVLVLICAANRDPVQFHAPDSFDVARHPNNHVAFGDGIHACIGAHRARLQVQNRTWLGRRVLPTA